MYAFVKGRYDWSGGYLNEFFKGRLSFFFGRLICFFSLSGLFVEGLFLHVWEDSMVNYLSLVECFVAGVFDVR